MLKLLVILATTMGIMAVLILYVFTPLVWLLVRLANWVRGPRDLDLERAEIEAEFKEAEKICSVSVQQAKRMVEESIRNGRFVCKLSTGKHSDIVGRLPPAARELFSRYDLISTACGSASIGPELFAMEPGLSQALRIGWSEDDPGVYLWLAPPLDVVLAEEPNLQERSWPYVPAWRKLLEAAKLENPPPPALVPVAPTVYHWLVLAERTFLGSEHE